jgi:hypothetical protein
MKFLVLGPLAAQGASGPPELGRPVERWQTVHLHRLERGLN